MNANISNDMTNLTSNNRMRPLPAILLATGLGLGVCLGPQAHAHCTILHPHHCAKDAVDAVEENVIDPIVDTGQDAVNTITDAYNTFDKAVISPTGQCLGNIKNCAEEVGSKITAPLKTAYQNIAKQVVATSGGPLVDAAEAFTDVATRYPKEFADFAKAVVNKNKTKIAKTLPVILKGIAKGPGQHGFESAIEHFKGKNAGSLLVILTAGGGYIAAGAEVSWGVALDIDYVRYLIKLAKSGTHTDYIQGTSPTVSVFKIVGGALGPQAGGSVDLSIGYHINNPEGVGGPSLDVSVEASYYAGAGFGVGYDVSTFPEFPPQLVAATAAVKTGIEVEGSIGGSYGEVMGQLCADWSVIVDDELAYNWIGPVLVPDGGGGDDICLSAATQISLRGAHNKYAVAERDGRMNANRSRAGAWEVFHLIAHSDGTVSLLSVHDQYVSAQSNGALVANRDTIGSWEKFTRIDNADGSVSFRSVHNKYFVAESNGAMNANRTAIGSWEKFKLEEAL